MNKNVTLSSLEYVKGDATRPLGDGNKIICHICNDAGGWGAGFVLALSRRWSEPEKAYRSIPKKNLKLGEVGFVRVEQDICVANMVAQHGYREVSGQPPIRYKALVDCFEKVVAYASSTGASLHMPRIGTGLAGGKWEHIEPILQRVCVERGVNVVVYDFG